MAEGRRLASEALILGHGFFVFAQRACTALRDASLRCSAVMLDARTEPPSFPPLRPILTKNSRISGGRVFFATPRLYVRPTRIAILSC
jgi:hypothetical protein